MRNNPCLKRRLLIGLAVFFLLIIFSNPVQAENDCPFGIENDPAPGQCGLYIDSDGNSICDHSETESSNTKEFKDTGIKKDHLSEDELKQLSVAEVAKFFSISSTLYSNELSNFLRIKVRETDSLQVLHDRNNLCSNVAASIAKGLQDSHGTSQIVDEGIDESVVKNSNTPTKSRYKLVLISIVLIVLYIISFLLVKAKYISLFTHHRIWNVLLLISFLVTALLSIMLVFRINFGWFSSFHLFILRWHVEFGSAMIIITFFHLSWHWQYYTAMLKKKIKAENENNK